MALSLPGGIKNAGDGGGEPLPLGGFANELFAAGGGEGVEAGFAIVGGDTPFGRNPATLFEALKGGVERAMFDEEFLFGSVLNGAGDALAVLWPEDKGAQDEQVESTLKKFETLLIVLG